MKSSKQLLRCAIWILLCALAMPGMSFAQGTITDGPVSLNFNADGQASGLTINGTYNLFASHWWHRIGGATAETAFPVLSQQSYVGNVATLDWDAMGATGNLFAHLVVTLDAVGLHGATVTQELTLTHVIPQQAPEGVDLNFQIFSYADFDLAASPGDDSATLLAPNSQMEVTDPSGGAVVYTGVGATAFKVMPYPTLQNQLNDAAITNLDNSGLPFGPADFTGAYQWPVTLPPQGSQTIVTTFELSGVGAPGVLEIPTLSPAGLGLLFLGFAALAVLRLRRRARA